MFRTINQRFYTIAGFLIFLFCLNYFQLAYFIDKESRIAAQGQDIVATERNIRNLLNLFFRMRYWERAVFSQQFPDAELQFGKTMAEMKSLLSVLRTRSPETSISRDLEEVAAILSSYEQDFNRLIQLDTEERLQLTRLETSYQSLASSILETGKLNFLKPLLIITNFQFGYVRARQQTEYRALNVVINSLKNKFNQEGLLNDRLEDYMEGYRRVLEEDFDIGREFETVTKRFNDTSAALTVRLKSISERTQDLLNNEFSAAETIRKRLKYSFLISSALGVVALLFVLMLVARKIVNPIQSVARVIMDIKAGKSSSRFTPAGGQKDDIVQLGLIFNDMLDTLEEKNHQLIEYQSELEAKVQELALRQQERETLIGELEVKNAELERFTYTVSHDLKSPLITIRGFLGFLQEDATAGDVQRLKSDIAYITAATDKMQRLLNDLLELSRIGRLMNPPEEIEFKEIVHEAVEMLSGRIKERKIQVEIATDRNKLYGDRQRLFEVFENLLDNAIKYLHLEPKPEIKVGIRSAGDEVVYYVQDNGIGVAPQYQDKIFGLFEKLDPEVEGTGVGLAIVKRIIEIHGGRIWVESGGIGCGSAFCFTLPFPSGPDTLEHP
jgi:signal transduction histidine kinase